MLRMPWQWLGYGGEDASFYLTDESEGLAGTHGLKGDVGRLDGEEGLQHGSSSASWKVSIPGHPSVGCCPAAAAASLLLSCAPGREVMASCFTHAARPSRAWLGLSRALLRPPAPPPCVPDPLQVCDVPHLSKLQYLTVVLACDQTVAQSHLKKAEYI